MPHRRRRLLPTMVAALAGLTLAVALPAAASPGATTVSGGTPEVLTIRRSLPMGFGGLAIDDHHDRLYISRPTGVEVLDTGTGASVGTLPVQVLGELVIDERRQWGFGEVETPEGRRLARLDLTSGAVVVSTEIPWLRWLAVEPRRGLLLAFAENRLVVLDAATLAVVHDVDLHDPTYEQDFSTPSALAVDGVTGLAHIYGFDASAAVVDITNGTVAPPVYGGVEIVDAAIDPGHLLFTSHFASVSWRSLRGPVLYGHAGMSASEEAMYMGHTSIVFDERNGLLWADNDFLAVFEVRGHREVVVVERWYDPDIGVGVADGAHRSMWSWRYDPATKTQYLVELALTTA